MGRIHAEGINSAARTDLWRAVLFSPPQSRQPQPYPLSFCRDNDFRTRYDYIDVHSDALPASGFRCGSEQYELMAPRSAKTRVDQACVAGSWKQRMTYHCVTVALQRTAIGVAGLTELLHTRIDTVSEADTQADQNRFRPMFPLGEALASLLSADAPATFKG
jgi:hypothetical protein